MNHLERNLAEFDKAHEGEHGFVLWDIWVLYADGARRSREGYGPLGNVIVEPSPAELERRKWQKIFWETRLEDLVEKFEAVKVAAQNNATSDPARFKVRLEELKTLQSQVRSARSRLTHITTQERGFTQADVTRAWDVWQEFVEASREESDASAKYQNALLGKSSPGVLEKTKHKFDLAKRRSQRAMDAWNLFRPVEARSVVCEQLDANHQAERFAELAEIEI